MVHGLLYPLYNIQLFFIENVKQERDMYLLRDKNCTNSKRHDTIKFKSLNIKYMSLHYIGMKYPHFPSVDSLELFLTV